MKTLLKLQKEQEKLRPILKLMILNYSELSSIDFDFSSLYNFTFGEIHEKFSKPSHYLENSSSDTEASKKPLQKKLSTLSDVFGFDKDNKRF